VLLDQGRVLAGDYLDGLVINSGPPQVVLAYCILAALHPAAPDVNTGADGIFVQIDFSFSLECPSRSSPVGTGGTAFQVFSVDAHV
jgi:hypothetical protein